MSSEDTLLRQTAWLFTRDQESVHIEIRTKDGGLRLVVAGPGHKSDSQDFPDLAPLEHYRQQMEQELTHNGFKLQAVTERRGGDGGGRRANDRRRAR